MSNISQEDYSQTNHNGLNTSQSQRDHKMGDSRSNKKENKMSDDGKEEWEDSVTFTDLSNQHIYESCFQELTDALVQEAQKSGEEFTKHDQEKLEWSLLPFKALEGVVEVLQYGAKKYSRDNWRKCDDLNRYRDAMMRHAIAYMSGEEIDPESGHKHLDHMMCCALFLKELEKPNE